MIRVALLVCLTAQPALACETALLLSIDVSGSIDAGDYRLQTEGLAAAISDPEVGEALVRGQVALAVVQWSGVAEQALVLSWQRMLSPEDVTRFAVRAGTMSRAFSGSDTAVGQGIRFATAQFLAVPDCRRKVIDISGDGPNNSGRPVTTARDEAVEKGIAINGLPISIKRPGYLDITDLDAYYEDCVIGGRNAFVIPITDRAQFAQTIRTKLIMEISDADPGPSRLVRKVQNRSRAHCMIGEEMFRNRMGN